MKLSQAIMFSFVRYQLQQVFNGFAAYLTVPPLVTSRSVIS